MKTFSENLYFIVYFLFSIFLLPNFTFAMGTKNIATALCLGSEMGLVILIFQLTVYAFRFIFRF